MKNLNGFLLILFSGILHADQKAGFRNVERVEAIPEELRGITVNDHRDIAKFFDAESARHESAPDLRFLRPDGGNYIFQQWINDVASDNKVYVFVSEDRTIYRMNGRIDRRQYPDPVHKLSEAEAIKKVLLHIINGGDRMFSKNMPVVREGNHHSMVLYREAVPWRAVAIEVNHPRSASEPDIWDQEWYLVNPNGDVLPWIDGGSVHAPHIELR